ncbi:MAG: hypothetical protein IKU61_05210 [Clostridia bacterium]|nr:hypothetical protein [Clostridia bacterium]
MLLSVRSQPIVKSVLYAVLSLFSLCFSAAFFPALGGDSGTPFLSVAIVAALTVREGIRYGSVFAAVLGALEAFVFGNSPLVFMLFYLGFAFLCTSLSGSFFSGGFLPWALFTLGGILLHAALGLFAPVANWQVSAFKLLSSGALQSILLSALFSLPIYWIVSKIKKKTE